MMGGDTKFTSPVLPNPDEWIRLLRIDSYNDDDNDDNREREENALPLSCTLQAFELTALPEYIALSYTCGKAVPDDLPEPFDSSKALPLAKALHSPHIDWTGTIWHLEVNNQRFHVARNLRDALKRLAGSHLNAWIWIDAISIDQDDLDERAAQVQIMWNIYSNAEEVIVWLGEEDETAIEAQLLQERLYPAIHEKSQNDEEWTRTENMHPSEEGYWESLNTEPVPMQWWWSWCHFYRRTWFQRVWTMQEYTLAKKLDVVCGSLHFNKNACVEIAIFVKNSTWTHHLVMTLGQATPLVHTGEPEVLLLETLRGMCVEGSFAFVRDVATIQYVCGIKSTSTWLLKMMANSKKRFVSDPRDRIYGMMGMLRHVGGNFGVIQDLDWLTVDYSATTSWRTLSVLVAVQMIMALPVLAYLSLVRYRPIEKVISERLPSWVVSLEEMDTGLMHPLGFDTVDSRAAYDVSGCEKTEMSFLRSSRHCSKGLSLKLKVLVVDDIDEILYEGPNTLDSNLEDALPPILQYMAERKSRYSIVQHSSWLPEAMWRTLIADKTLECPAEIDTALAFKEWVLSMMLNTLGRRRTASDTAILDRRLAQNMDYLDQIHQKYPPHAVVCLPTATDVLDAYEYQDAYPRSSNWLQLVHRFSGFLAYSGRKLVATRGGALALVPSEAQKGDALIIVAGARVPFVVKLHTVILDSSDPGREESLAFQLVGEAYVHGIMHGEVCESLAADGKEVPWNDFTFV